jgi:hypothetical protein
MTSSGFHLIVYLTSLLTTGTEFKIQMAQFPSPAWCRSYPAKTDKFEADASLGFDRHLAKNTQKEYLTPPCENVRNIELLSPSKPSEEIPTEGSLMSNFSFLLDSTATGLVTWFGTMLTLFGLYQTWKQARKSATAAIAARKAIGDVEKRVLSSNLTHISSQLSKINDLILANQFGAANSVFDLTKRVLVQTCHLLEKLNPEDEHAGLIKRNMRTIQHQITLISNGQQDNSILEKAITGMSETLFELEAEFTFPVQTGEQ